MIYPRVKELRLEKGLTQRQAASAAGVSLSAYRRMETTGHIYDYELVQLSIFYDVPTDYILNRTDQREIHRARSAIENRLVRFARSAFLRRAQKYVPRAFHHAGHNVLSQQIARDLCRRQRNRAHGAAGCPRVSSFVHFLDKQEMDPGRAEGAISQARGGRNANAHRAQSRGACKAPIILRLRPRLRQRSQRHWPRRYRCALPERISR